jgi:glycosyltransferase involved in cell wall biosynthesis
VNTKTPAEVRWPDAKNLSSSPAFDQICRVARMKLLVFAHTPPPHHGQSYMVKLMLDGFGGDCRRQKEKSPDGHGIECYHVNARYSKTLEDVGEFQGTKIFLILFYCLQALWCRFRHGVTNLYYVPAPGKAVAVYRDWLVMLICRPFFKHIILHWHAAGLAKWLETSVQIRSRAITYRLFKPVDLSIVLSRYNVADAEKLLSRTIAIVPVGVPGLDMDFAEKIRTQRRARIAVRQKILAGEISSAPGTANIINVLFLAHCTREKGVFDTVEGVALANEAFAAEKSPLQFRLTLVGAFATENEEKELRELIRQRGVQNAVEILGFVSAERKAQALTDADIFCFPTYYLAENQPGNLIEAMAYGLPIVTTRWRSIPEMLPENYPGLVNPKSPEQVAAALRLVAAGDFTGPLRELFLRRFTLEQHLAGMAAAIRSVEAS